MVGEADPVSCAMLLPYSPDHILGHHGEELFLVPGLDGNKLLGLTGELHLDFYPNLEMCMFKNIASCMPTWALSINLP